MDCEIDILFTRYRDEICRGFRRRGHNAEDAADLTQDVFLRFIRGGTRQPANPGAYLHRIARNLSIDVWRRQYGHDMPDLPDELICALPDPQPGQEVALAHRQHLEIVEQTLLSLPLHTRRAFTLYQLEGLTMAQTAEEIGLSVSRTWTLVQRAYDTLRAALAEAETSAPKDVRAS